MAYAGLANKRIVARLIGRGVAAIGLTGVDGRLWEAAAKKDLCGRRRENQALPRQPHRPRREGQRLPPPAHCCGTAISPSCARRP